MPSNQSSYADYVLSKTPGVLRFEVTVCVLPWFFLDWVRELMNEASARLGEALFLVNKLNCSSKEDMLGYSILSSIYEFRNFIKGITNSIVKAQNNLAFIEPILLNFTDSTFDSSVRIRHPWRTWRNRRSDKEAQSEVWKHTVAGGAMSIAANFLFAARLVYSSEGGAFLSWINMATGLASGANSIDSGVIAKIVQQTVQVLVIHLLLPSQTHFPLSSVYRLVLTTWKS